MKSVDVSLYLVTNSDGCDEKRFLSILEAALQNGVTLVQLREKEKTSEAYYTLAVAVKKITDYYGVPLILDDRADIALAADAALPSLEAAVNVREDGDTSVIELSVDPADVGKVIGKQGRIAKAIRVVVRAAAVRQGEKVIVEID